MTDERRLQTALSRVRLARESMAYHQRAVASEKAKIDILVRTWGLCPITYGECCLNPEGCSQRDTLTVID